MTELRIITDADLADMAPHIAERAQAELAERAECNDNAVATLIRTRTSASTVTTATGVTSTVCPTRFRT